ncbi:hypothetical protein AMTR_s00009p00252020 [Amborella trichopoda]|uniref:Sphingomyelin synthase-like domain-containing protein n=1 Tax=Amborella trichopoda TaxID=13333 RepID=W1NHX2_AMBTC|nr:hypothetical protein AMTR_s00009p00252020 [Amborella trichopoda]
MRSATIQLYMKQLAWLGAVLLSILIVASRKHYTVDVIVAWYTVYLVIHFINHKLSKGEIYCSMENTGPIHTFHANKHHPI